MSRDDPLVSVHERPMSLSPCFLGFRGGGCDEEGIQKRAGCREVQRGDLESLPARENTLRVLGYCEKSSRETAQSLQQLPTWSSSRYCYQKVKGRDP